MRANYRAATDINYKPGANVGQSPQAEDELDGVEDALQQEESSELHDWWIDDVHQEAGDVGDLLRWDGEVGSLDALEGVTPWLCLLKHLVETIMK